MSGDELEDVNNEGDPEMRRTQIEISLTEFGDESSKSASMSGLSLASSSSSDDGPIMMGIRNSRRARIKRLRETNQDKISDSDSPRRNSSRNIANQANKVTPGKSAKHNTAK